MKYLVIFLLTVIYTILLFIIGSVGNVLHILWHSKLELTDPFVSIVESKKGKGDWFPLFETVSHDRMSYNTYKSYFHWIWGIK